MVLTQKLGKQRNFGLVVLLYIVTFGIYGIYWHYKVHSEVYKQFELQRDGKDEGIVWLILGIVLFQPLMWVYQWLFVSNVRYVRERLGFEKNLSAGTFLGLSIPGGILAGIGVFFLIFGVAVSAGDLDDPELSEEERDFLEAMQGIAAGGAVVGGLMLVGGFAMMLIAFARLQGDVNGIWQAYDRRMGQLSSGPPSGGSGAWDEAPAGPPAGGAPTASQATRPPSDPWR